MKILVLCYEYPPIGGGGGRVAKSVAEALARRGHEVRVQTAALGWRSIRETLGGVKVFRTASLRRRADTCAVHEMALFCATSFMPALRHATQWRPDVMHAHFAMPTGLLARAVHALTGIPYVLTAHLGDVPGGVPEQTDGLFRFLQPVARRIWAGAAARTAVSSFVQRLAERAYGHSVARILNGIDLTDGLPAPSPAHRPPHFLFVGRFTQQKQPQIFVQALAKLAALDWQATLIGDGPLLPMIRELIARDRLWHRLPRAGWLAAPDVRRALARADVLVMPSLAEGLPLAGIEALAHGLALVVSDSPGLSDLIDDGVNGFVFPVGNVEALSHKLRWLIESPGTLLAMKRASRQKARGFDLAAMVDQYETVLLTAACEAVELAP